MVAFIAVFAFGCSLNAAIIDRRHKDVIMESITLEEGLSELGRIFNVPIEVRGDVPDSGPFNIKMESVTFEQVLREVIKKSGARNTVLSFDNESGAVSIRVLRSSLQRVVYGEPWLGDGPFPPGEGSGGFTPEELAGLVASSDFSPFPPGEAGGFTPEEMAIIGDSYSDGPFPPGEGGGFSPEELSTLKNAYDSGPLPPGEGGGFSPEELSTLKNAYDSGPLPPGGGGGFSPEELSTFE